MHHNLVKQDPSSSSFIYGQDSIEIAPSESVDEDDIYDQSDLTEKILIAEKKFSTSSITTSYFSSQYFEHPALYRVLFMGSTSELTKKELFKKLSQGFVHVLQQQRNKETTKTVSLFSQPITPFKETKHNVLLLSDPDDEDLISDTCEDIGVSLIEADFTWNSNAVSYANHPDTLLLQYAWHQCPNPRELPAAAWVENKLFKSKFTGYMYPERTPNGIDLCVYFYDGQNDERTKQDLLLLCTLRKLGIYVLPLTTVRDEQLKSRLADFLTEYKVRCLDLGNLDVGQEEPSFQKHVTQVDRLHRLQDMECTHSNMPRVATYQILAVDQFCAIENKAIFQLLKRTRERQVIREVLKEELISQRRQEQSLEDSRSDSSDNEQDDRSLLTSKTRWYFDHYQFLKTTIIGLLFMFACTHIYNYYHTPSIWTASFKLQSDLSFVLYTQDSKGHSDWAETEPQVWLNDRHLVPIEKKHEKPGYYDLKLNFISQDEPWHAFSFTVNTTMPNIAYKQDTPMTFLLFYVKQNHTNQRQSVQVLNQQETKPLVSHDQDSSIKNAWDSFVFLASNTYSNILNIIFVD